MASPGMARRAGNFMLSLFRASQPLSGIRREFKLPPILPHLIRHLIQCDKLLGLGPSLLSKEMTVTSGTRARNKCWAAKNKGPLVSSQDVRRGHRTTIIEECLASSAAHIVQLEGGTKQ